MSGPKITRRITNYTDASPKSRVVIDYCARHRLVPRKKDEDDLPSSWCAVSSCEVRDRIAADLDINLDERRPALVWEKLGANVDIASALSFLKNRHEEFLDEGFERASEWEREKSTS
jgi:hypothetical protein